MFYELHMEVSKVASDRFKWYILILIVNRWVSEPAEMQFTLRRNVYELRKYVQVASDRFKWHTSILIVNYWKPEQEVAQDTFVREVLALNI